jgi:hypothetical protein
MAEGFVMEKIIYLVLFTLLSSSSNAEPSSTIRYLINEPMSMLDWGLYRIQLDLNRIRSLTPSPESESPSDHEVRYDWDENRIEISANIYPSHQYVMDTGIDDICRDAFWLLKSLFDWNREPIFRATDGVAGFFEHTDYLDKAEPPSKQRDIEVITFFKVTVITNNPNEGIKGMYKKKLSCFGRYLDKDISYTRYN